MDVTSLPPPRPRSCAHRVNCWVLLRVQCGNTKGLLWNQSPGDCPSPHSLPASIPSPPADLCFIPQTSMLLRSKPSLRLRIPRWAWPLSSAPRPMASASTLVLVMWIFIRIVASKRPGSCQPPLQIFQCCPGAPKIKTKTLILVGPIPSVPISLAFGP